MPHYADSYRFGKAEEKKVLPIVSDYFKREIKAYPNQYDHHDLYDDEYDYEVKSRTNKKNAFPDTMITMDKMMNLTKPLILLFNYTDRLSFIKYDAVKFATYRKMMFARSKKDCDLKEHLFIPIGDLTDICEWREGDAVMSASYQPTTEKNPAYKSSNGF
ncbi:hypothetical protein [Dishui Lake virophage 2]|nr:hypothetical protein [Dishui Lake virophage 2]